MPLSSVETTKLPASIEKESDRKVHLNFVRVVWRKLRRKQVELSSSYFAHLENSAIVKTGTTRALAANRQLRMELIKISPRVNTRISFLGTRLIMELGIVLAFFRAQWNSFECLFREVIKELEANDAQFWLLCAIHSLPGCKAGVIFLRRFFSLDIPATYAAVIYTPTEVLHFWQRKICRRGYRCNRCRHQRPDATCMLEITLSLAQLYTAVETVQNSTQTVSAINLNQLWRVV